MPPKKTIKSAVADSLKKKSTFNLKDYKKSNNLSKNARFKKQEWIPLSPAFNKAIGLPGIPHGHIIVLRGHPDTGKTISLVEAAISVQKMGKLPVFVITEMKWSWQHAKQMGFPVEETIDKETGEITYDGDFIYVDRNSLNTIEDVAEFIAKTLNAQEKGIIDRDLVFLWDSVGSITCQQSLDSGKNNPMWQAGAYSQQFGNFINQRIPLSRKADYPYTNSMILINKVRVEYPIGMGPMAKPKMRNKGGDCFLWDCTLCITFGNVTNSGTSKIEAVKDGEKVTFAKRTKISVDKNHITDSTTSTRIIMTTHGFIEDTPEALAKYKKEHSKEWLSILGEGSFEVIEEEDVPEDHRSVLNQIPLDEDE